MRLQPACRVIDVGDRQQISLFLFFFFNDTATTEIYTLSLHDALPIFGMAIARKWLASRYNRPGFEIFDYDIFAVCGDGCLMEGVGSEAASLAGHLELDDLCWIYDNNHITIEGNTRIAFTEDVAVRFQGYRWNV